MYNHIVNLYNLSAQNELRFDALINAPASVSGLFVDAFIDDDMRDSGTTQTAVVSENLLQLPMNISSKTFETGKEISLDYSNVDLIKQELHTKSIQVNPYQAFDPMPVSITISPSVDRWVETTTTNGGYIYKYLTASQAYAKGYTKSQLWVNNGHQYTYSNDIASSTTSTTSIKDNLRQLTITLKAKGFAPNEVCDIYFDSIFIKNVTADTSGNVNTTFVIPAGIPNGTKLVRIVGKTYNKNGYAYYVGTHEKKTVINYYYKYQLDPVAQTFTLNESRHVSGVQFFLTKKGTSDLIVELRETVNGYPKAQSTITSVRLAIGELVQNGWNTAIFDTPVFLSGGVEYCFAILTDTADHNVGISELGDYDSSTGWVRSQPYSTGVMFSSSNASTWTAHQSADMAFRLLGANFTNNTKEVNLGTVSLSNVSDIVPFAEVESTSSSTGIEFILKNSSGVIVGTSEPWQSMMFETPLTGTYTLLARLNGESKYSPILGRDPQIIIGSIQSTGDYISRAFACGTSKKVRITTTELEPTGSSIVVSAETANNTFTECTEVKSSFLGDGWYTKVYEVNCDLDYTRVKIVLTGSSAARPYVGSLSAVILDA